MEFKEKFEILLKTEEGLKYRRIKELSGTTVEHIKEMYPKAIRILQYYRVSVSQTAFYRSE